MHISTVTDAVRHQRWYTPNETVIQSLHNKSAVLFVAPAGTGKTYLIDQLAGMDKAFARVPVFTTRLPRPDDSPGMFRILPHDDAHIKSIFQKITRGELVQYVVHPSGRIYGTEPDDFPGRFNMLATLSEGVEQAARLPFKHTFVVGVVTETDTWESWFNTRFPIGNNQRTKRLHEAIESLTWLIDQPTDRLIWAQNVPGEGERTADSLIDAILYNKNTEDASQLAKNMLQRAKEMDLTDIRH